MEWRDEGVILSVRKHGETSAIAEILTPEHGRCHGAWCVVAAHACNAPCCNPEILWQATWRAPH